MAENYLVITYDLIPEAGKTTVTTTIENFNGDPDWCKHIAKGWDEVVISGPRNLFSQASG